MNKEHARRYYLILGIIWFVTGTINILVSKNYLFAQTSMGVTYICLAGTCMCLAFFYIARGIKNKR